MSPPSLATAGRTRVSISSLMVATVSASAASKNSSLVIVVAGDTVASSGAPEMKCSMITPRIIGFSSGQSLALLVTVMKSAPKKTPVTPAISNKPSASGDCAAPAGSRKSSVPFPASTRPGRNLRVAGFGVGSVSINMESSVGSRARRIAAGHGRD